MLTVAGRCEGTLVPPLWWPVLPGSVRMRAVDGAPPVHVLFLADGTKIEADGAGVVTVPRAGVEPLLGAGLVALLAGGRTFP